MKHVLLIGGRDHTIHKLKKLGISYTMIQTASLVTEEQIKSSKKLIVMDYKNSNEVIEMATILHKINPFNAIISFAEYGMHAAVLCSQKFNLPTNSLFPIENTRDKFEMRKLLRQNNLATVNFQICNTPEDVLSFFLLMNKNPIIIKPATSAGSKGISFIDNQEEIQPAWKWTTDVGSYPVLAEEYIDGNEYSIETLSFDGNHEIAMIVEKNTTSYPHFIETGHQAPAQLEPILRDKIHKTIYKFLDVIQQKTGPTHTEIKINNNEIKIIESQTRIGGDQIWEMTEMVAGIDQMTETICHLLDLPKPLRKKSFKAAAVKFFAHENMTIKKILNVDQVKMIPGIIRVDCKAKVGDKLNTLKSSDSRQGYVLAAGEKLEDVITIVNKAINTIIFN